MHITGITLYYINLILFDANLCNTIIYFENMLCLFSVTLWNFSSLQVGFDLIFISVILQLQIMRNRARKKSPHIRQIDIDVNRTYRNHIMFRERYGVKQVTFNLLNSMVNEIPKLMIRSVVIRSDSIFQLFEILRLMLKAFIIRLKYEQEALGQ